MARANVKTVELAGAELEVTDLGGQNAAIKNLSSSTVWASAFPNVAAGADNVVEIPAGSGEVVLDARGTVYLLGTGKVQCTGTPYATLNFKLPSQSESGGGGGVDDATKAYVDARDIANLGEAKTYTDTEVNAVKEDVSDNTDRISAVRTELTAAQTEISESISDLQTTKADKSELPTTLPANGGNADTVNGHTVDADVPGDAKFTDTIVDISGKMDKENPTGTGAFSMNRKSGSTVGEYSFAGGFDCVASNSYAYAEGYAVTASGDVSHGEGSHTTAEGGGSHVEGLYCSVVGKSSHSQGYASRSEHHSSFAAGNRTLTGREFDTVLGFLNAPKSNSLLTIGFGAGVPGINMSDCPSNTDYNTYGREGATLKNVFRVDTGGKVYGIGAFNTSGADYAEYIKPWFDDNAENEDRRGYFVTVKDGKLRFAEPNDYIVGITSGNPSVVGNGDEDWLGRWQRDEFNELVYQDVEVDDYGESEDENGNIVSVKIGSHTEKQTVEVPEYDSSQKYIERKDRPEWSYVGMIGVIPLRDDGTCAAGGFAKCGAGGIATAAAEWECHKTFFVIERINDHVISVEMR